jgi:hypothetical protein
VNGFRRLWRALTAASSWARNGLLLIGSSIGAPNGDVARARSRNLMTHERETSQAREGERSDERTT